MVYFRVAGFQSIVLDRRDNILISDNNTIKTAFKHFRSLAYCTRAFLILACSSIRKVAESIFCLQTLGNVGKKGTPSVVFHLKFSMTGM